ncbi:MAG: hypothetical protein NZT92_02470 [Abditibacteriales bacterium]|nr:hypothetical protein [Abditibacteriales bacterium]MDW8365884.1 hypothetical protein [Abditibacteriales bacterium]
MQTLRVTGWLMVLCMLFVGVAEAKKRKPKDKVKPKPAVNLTGTWDGVIETQFGDIAFTLEVTQPAGAQTFEARMTIVNPQTDEPITVSGSGQVDKKGKFSSGGDVLYQGQPVHIEITGSVSGNRMSGDIEVSSGGQRMGADFHATRR